MHGLSAKASHHHDLATQLKAHLKLQRREAWKSINTLTHLVLFVYEPLPRLKQESSICHFGRVLLGVTPLDQLVATLHMM